MSFLIGPSVVASWCALYGLEVRGEGDRSLDAIDDTNSFALLVRRAVRIFRPRTVLDVGCGCGIPTLEAARAGAQRVFGIDIERTNVRLAARNVARTGYASQVALRETGWESVAADPEVLPPIDLLVANPPYVPGATPVAVNGGEDGTRMLRDIIERAPTGIEAMALLFSSLSNPLALLERIDGLGWRIREMLVHAVPFGRYTSEASTLSHLFALRERRRAYFAPRAQRGSHAPFVYLVLGVVLGRNGIPARDVVPPMQRLLAAFEDAGTDTLRTADLPVRADVRAYGGSIEGGEVE